jgi:hypothetical protein
MSLVPERRIGVIMMGNSYGMDYSIVADAVLAILMDRNPDDVVPALGVQRRMQALAGTYYTYRNMGSIDVVQHGGMLQLRDGEDLTPLIPEDSSYRGTRFYTLSGSRKTPIEFRRDDAGKLSLLIGRYVYHQQPGS